MFILTTAFGTPLEFIIHFHAKDVAMNVAWIEDIS